MRSSDFFLGLPYDVQQFCFLQQLVAHWLRMECGPFYHFAASAHIYDKDVNAAEKVIAGSGRLNSQFEPDVDIPHDSAPEQVRVFFEIERQIRYGSIRQLQELPAYYGLGTYLAECLDKVANHVERMAHERVQLALGLSA